MKFYDRTEELKMLSQRREIAFNDHSQLTVLTGRRRIGKTMLIHKSCEGTPMVYLFVGRSNEASLCRSFAQEINQTLTSIFVPENIESFADLFEMLMRAGMNERFNLVIDEFQEFYYINPSIFSRIQDIWDRYKDITHVFMVASGSIYTLMRRIFQDAKEPLYGRCDSIIKLKAFSTSVLKEILADYKPDYSNDDLLALYTFTGGVPKYIDLLMQNHCTDAYSMIDYILQPDSTFINEGNAMLIQEFGRNYGNYFAVLADIASGRNTLPEIESAMGNINIAGHIKRLEEDYELITKKRPLLAKKSSQTVRYEISDLFLRFWFRYLFKHRSIIEIGNYNQLKLLIKNDYSTFSGLVLEDYFKKKMAESQEFVDIGAWWQAKRGKEACEIDIVAIRNDGKHAVVAEVKRQRKNFKPEDFAKKVETIKKKSLSAYEIEPLCLSIEDM